MNIYAVIFKPMKKIIFLFLFAIISEDNFSQKTFDFNSNCQQAYNEIMKLKLDSGQRILNKEKQINPNNLIPFF